MQLRDLLAAKGYDIQTRDFGTHWLCVLEWHDQIRNFSAHNEEDSIRRAARYVAELEAGYEEQRLRLVCEGCGE